MQLDLLYRETFVDIIDGMPVYNHYYLMDDDDFYRGNGRYINQTAEDYEMCLNNAHLDYYAEQMTVADFLEMVIFPPALPTPFEMLAFSQLGIRKYFLN